MRVGATAPRVHRGAMGTNMRRNPLGAVSVRLLGATANLAYQLSGGLPGNLHKTTLVAQKNQVTLMLSPAKVRQAREAARAKALDVLARIGLSDTADNPSQTCRMGHKSWSVWHEP